MRAPTHATLGVLSALLVAHHHHFHITAPDEVLLLSTIGAVAALLPDIDHPNAILRQRLSMLGDVAFFWLKHRGITHSLLALGVVSVGAVSMFQEIPLAYAVIAGYASHLFGDFITPAGIPLLYPSKCRVRLPLIKTGSLLEWLICLLCAGVGIVLGFRFIL